MNARRNATEVGESAVGSMVSLLRVLGLPFIAPLDLEVSGSESQHDALMCQTEKSVKFDEKYEAADLDAEQTFADHLGHLSFRMFDSCAPLPRDC